jgi:hypothetical protein
VQKSTTIIAYLLSKSKAYLVNSLEQSQPNIVPFYFGWFWLEGVAKSLSLGGGLPALAVGQGNAWLLPFEERFCARLPPLGERFGLANLLRSCFWGGAACGTMAST